MPVGLFGVRIFSDVRLLPAHAQNRADSDTEKENYVMNIGYILFFIVEAIMGVLSTVYLFVSLFFVIGQKIYRKVKYGISLYD